jgi:NADH dehydrogenase (ubiquinone) 1 alpha/beta subcomplex 1
VGANAHFTNDLGLDSLDSAEVVMEVENEFAVEIPGNISHNKILKVILDEEAFKLQTVNDCIQYISQNPLAK